MDYYQNKIGYKKRRTSYNAGISMLKNGKRLTIRKQCLQVVKNKGLYGATPDEVAELLELPITTVRPRFSELVDMKCIKDLQQTRRNQSGKQAIVWGYKKDEK